MVCYDYQLRTGRRKFGNQFLTFNLCCRNRLLASFPVAIGRPLTGLAAKREIVDEDPISNKSVVVTENHERRKIK